MGKPYTLLESRSSHGLWRTEKRVHALVGEKVAFFHRDRRCRSLQYTADVDFGRAMTALEALDPGARERLAQDV